MSSEKIYHYLKDRISFESEKASSIRTLYFPLCGVDAKHLKSSITPHLSGDIKIDRDHFLTKPVSREDLRENVRNFFVQIKGKGIFPLVANCPPSKSKLRMGPLWHELIVRYEEAGLSFEALNFIPVSGENVELMRIKIINHSSETMTIIPTSAIPIFGRALGNKHDHEHVTSLLHRIYQNPEGVLVFPSMSFDERGHKINDEVYFVYGADDQGHLPIGSFPTTEVFYGDQGSRDFPQAIYANQTPTSYPEEIIHGKEAMGALRFAERTLGPKESCEIILMLGVGESIHHAKKVFEKFKLLDHVNIALDQNKKFWLEKATSIEFKTSDANFDSWLHWVTLQPIFRRIFGCSFLPDHDYGKGGKGWRDLWQDRLSLILIEPSAVREHLVNNFGGVRIDGSNATIIGTQPGEFIADRNAITRVWMDHGVWPWVTTQLYINQTGDFDILFEKNSYFRDPQIFRTFQKDSTWNPKVGMQLKTKKGKVYQGTILEHILVQNLVQFFNVGEHNITRLESADWNDGLDMAFERGESVAFMSFYGGNLLSIAQLLEKLAQEKKIKKIRIFKELTILLDSLKASGINYNSIPAKKNLLFKKYFPSVQPAISGLQIDLDVHKLICDLRAKGEWILKHISQKEKITIKESGQTYTWFNGYYDNRGQRVEGKKKDRLWMTLTGQVFPIMNGVGTREDMAQAANSVRAFLKDKKRGGFRLNTDFGLPHYLDFGRAFGFYYGTKENGAFFSHMTVMYAYALYKQGFVEQGHEVLDSIYQMAKDVSRSKIYPGIPEYFDSNGQGMYHYLTGSASWLILTQLTQVFGVRGEGGDLVLNPKLLKEQFVSNHEASVCLEFANKRLKVVYKNVRDLNWDHYKIAKITTTSGATLKCHLFQSQHAQIPRQELKKLQSQDTILVELI